MKKKIVYIICILIVSQLAFFIGKMQIKKPMLDLQEYTFESSGLYLSFIDKETGLFYDYWIPKENLEKIGYTD